jgi:multiple sugar transport system permease protein
MSRSRFSEQPSPMAQPKSFLWTRRVVLTLLLAFVLIPVYVMVSSSLKNLQDVQGSFKWIPHSLTVKPYVDIWKTIPLAHYFVNFTVSVLATQMFPGILFLLPLYLIFVNIGNTTGITLNGSRLGLIITYLTFSLPFSIWMLAGYFDSIPRDLDEAAKVDGCGPIRALFQVVVPAAVPGIIAVSVYAFMTAWGEVLFASVMTNQSTRTLAVGLREYATQNDVYWNQVMAASIVVSVPVVAGFLLLQRYLVAGLTAGAVK